MGFLRLEPDLTHRKFAKSLHADPSCKRHPAISTADSSEHMRIDAYRRLSLRMRR